MPINRQPNSLTVLMSLLGVNSSTDIFIDSLREPPVVAPDHSLLHPIVWLNGTRPANTCILPSFPWIRHEKMPTNAHQWVLSRWWCTTLTTLVAIGGHYWWDYTVNEMGFQWDGGQWITNTPKNLQGKNPLAYFILKPLANKKLIITWTPVGEEVGGGRYIPAWSISGWPDFFRLELKFREAECLFRFVGDENRK